MEKIVLTIEIEIPENFYFEYIKSELRDLENDVRYKFEEITGYAIKNIYAEIE